MAVRKQKIQHSIKRNFMIAILKYNAGNVTSENGSKKSHSTVVTDDIEVLKAADSNFGCYEAVQRCT
jgi:hypothetical protein